MKPCAFDELPYRNPGPPYNAWGAFGDDDQLGRVNLITPESVKRGRDAIEHGIVINLNLPMSLDTGHPARSLATHTINHRVHANDDIVSFNTQSSTQWDGFRHYPYQNYPEKGQYRFYNGQTMDDAKDPGVSRNGTQNFVKKPISSRAHLLDIPRYLARHELPCLRNYEPDNPITVDMLKACAAEEGVVFAPGDILIVRSGFTDAMYARTPEEVEAHSRRAKRYSCGVEQGVEMLRFHWDNGIAAVVGDSPAYENFPTDHSPKLHEVFLAGWGMPIGELFDLRELGEACDRLKKWTFFFTSMPLYFEAGIASPPNAQAIL